MTRKDDEMAVDCDFRIGDQVSLRSGGPIMVVSSLPSQFSTGLGITCQWFAAAEYEDAYGDLHEGSFHPDCLEMKAKGPGWSEEEGK